MPAFRDLAGQRFGRLIALHTNGRNSQGVYKWLCRCDCGNEKTVVGTYLTQGSTTSCGCLHTELMVAYNKSKEKSEITSRQNSILKRKHGKTGSRLYRVWTGMKARCYNEKSPSYQYYGGRGISICEEWLCDFGAFRDWAAKNGYDENAPHGECTIDRVDNNGNYEPSNCRWVSISVQNKNKRPGGRRSA